MPVLRNPQYYFKEGFCWSNVLTTYIKCRKKQKTIHSTESMSLFSVTECVPEFYMISLINSRFMAYYIESFINSTSHCTTGDAKLIPVLIPTADKLQSVKEIFDKAIIIRVKESKNFISAQEAEAMLDLIQKNLDSTMSELYGINAETIQPANIETM
jgi:hypothetical protein